MLQQYAILVIFVMMFAGLFGLFIRRHFLQLVYCGALVFLSIILLFAHTSSTGDPNINLIVAALILCALPVFALCAHAYIFLRLVGNSTAVGEFRNLRG